MPEGSFLMWKLLKKSIDDFDCHVMTHGKLQKCADKVYSDSIWD